jgi:hypothetical protein
MGTMATKKIGHFDICRALAAADKNIQIAPLENITSLRKVKAGTQVTIGVPGDLVKAIGLQNKYVGGLLLIDREEYLSMKAELEKSDNGN